MSICFELNHLAGADRRIAEYLMRLAQYREVAAEFAAELAERGESSIVSVDKAQSLLLAAEEAALQDMMLPLADAARATGFSHSHLRKLVREHGPDGDRQVRAERRHGNSWYVYAPDVDLLVEVDEDRHGPYQRRDREE